MLQLRRKIAGLLLSGAFLPAALWLAPAEVRAQTTITDGAIVTVPGTYPSPWSTDTLVVGTPLNSGTLIIQNGGSVISLANLDAPAVQVASGIGSVGAVTVEGAGSVWTYGGGKEMWIGN